MAPAAMKTPFFLSVDAFENNYAGKSTILLESQALERAGRQDGFCAVCKKGKADAKLFPQVAPGQIHFCPRRFCEDCCVIKDEWRRDLRASNLSNDRERYRNIPVCCPLCVRRGWQSVCPFLGPGNPEWEGRDPQQKERISTLRYKTWETKSHQDPDRRKLFQQRPVDDDGSLDSDCQILQAVKDGLLKPGVEFVPISAGDASETRSWKEIPSKSRMLDPFIIFQIAYNYLVEELEQDFLKNADYGISFGGLSSQPKKKLQPVRSGQRGGKTHPGQSQTPCCRCREPLAPMPRNDNWLNTGYRDYVPMQGKFAGVNHNLPRLLTTPATMHSHQGRHPSLVAIRPNSGPSSPEDTHSSAVMRLGSVVDNQQRGLTPIDGRRDSATDWQTAGKKRSRAPTIGENGVESPCSSSSDNESFSANMAEWPGFGPRELPPTHQSHPADNEAIRRARINPGMLEPVRAGTDKRHQRHRPNRLHLGASPAQRNNKLPTPLGTPTAETPSASARASFSSAGSADRDYSQSQRLVDLEAAIARLAAENNRVVAENAQLRTDAVSRRQSLALSPQFSRQ